MAVFQGVCSKALGLHSNKNTCNEFGNNCRGATFAGPGQPSAVPFSRSSSGLPSQCSFSTENLSFAGRPTQADPLPGTVSYLDVPRTSSPDWREFEVFWNPPWLRSLPGMAAIRLDLSARVRLSVCVERKVT